MIHPDLQVSCPNCGTKLILHTARLVDTPRSCWDSKAMLSYYRTGEIVCTCCSHTIKAKLQVLSYGEN